LTNVRRHRYATICALAGVDPTDTNAAKYGLPPIDSLNMWPLLTGEVVDSPRENILVTEDLLVAGDYKIMTGKAVGAGWAGPQYPNVSSHGHDEGSVTLDCAAGCLFNVANDPTEYVPHRENLCPSAVLGCLAILCYPLASLTFPYVSSPAMDHRVPISILFA